MDEKNQSPETGNTPDKAVPLNKEKTENGDLANNVVAPQEGPSGDLPELFQPKYIDPDLKDYHVVQIEEIDEQTDAGYAGGRGNDGRPPPPSYEDSVQHRNYRSNNQATYGTRTRPLEDDDYVAGNETFPIFVPFSPEDRQSFIQRVYMTLTIQLSFVLVFILLVTFVMSVRDFVKTYYMYLLIGGFICYVIPLFSITCCYAARHKFPINHILLTMLTVGLGTIATISTIMYTTDVVLYAIVTCTVICFTVSIIAIWMPIDLTKCGALMCVLALIIIVFAFTIMIMYLFGIYFEILDLVFSFIAVVVFSIFLMYDTQQIIGGRRYYIDPSEHILGATLLFVDIILIFLYLLRIIGYFNR